MADPSKSEAATPRRREEARKRGQVARSVELTSALTLLGMLVVLRLAGGTILDELAKVCRFAWGGLGTFNLEGANLQAHAFTFGLELLLVLGPLLLGAFLLGVAANLLQFGFLFAPEALSLKLDNLSPVRGFQRLLSRRTAVETLKSFVKIGLIGFTAWYAIKGELPRLLDFMGSDQEAFLKGLADLSSAVMLKVALVTLGLALVDYLYQRWEYEESLKMSKQEIKDEMRQMEGDPMVKARIRKLQQEAARRRMFSQLPEADVVITNPTHLAVAVKYDGESMDAPLVVAKGARLMAARIREIAKENSIPVMENKPLARALFNGVPVGGAVPSAFFAAIAEVLAFVYQAKGTLERKALQNQRRIARKALDRRLGGAKPMSAS